MVCPPPLLTPSQPTIMRGANSKRELPTGSVVVLSAFSTHASVGLRTRSSYVRAKSRSIVMRLGVVFPMSINIPFSIIDGARIGTFRDGTGQLALTLGKAHRLAYIALWPHCQVFRFTHPEPVLRALRDPKAISALLVNAVAAAGETDVQIAPVTLAPAGPSGASPTAVGTVSSGVA